MRFVSPSKNLVLMGGPKGDIRFIEGTYDAQDKEEATWMQRHRWFNYRFFPESKAPMTPPPSKDGPEVQIRLLEAEKTAAERQLMEVTRELAETKNALTRSEAQVASRKEMIRGLEARLMEADQKNAALQEQVETLREELEQMQGLKDEIERLKEQNEQLLNRLEATKSKSRKVQREAEVTPDGHGDV